MRNICFLSFKTKELSFAQFVYVLRKVSLFFNFRMIIFTIMFCDIIVNFIIQKLKRKHTSAGFLLLPSSRDKGTPGQENFFVSGQRDNGTSRPVETLVLMLKWARLLYFCMYLYNVVTDIFIFPCGYLNLQSYECVR